MKTPLILPLISLIAGIIVSSAWNIGVSVIVGALCFSFVVVLFARFSNRPLFSLSALSVGFFSLGLLTYHLHFPGDVPENHVVNFVGKEKCIVEGVIRELPTFTSERTEFVLHACYIYRPGEEPVPVQGKVLVVGPPGMDVDYGQYLRIIARLRKPASFENPGSFDYTRFLYHRGILVRCTLNRETDYLVIREVSSGYFMKVLSGTRKKLRELINQNVKSPSSGIIQALILGDTRDIPPAVRDKFNATGTSHILAISGFHVGVVTLVSFYLFRSLLYVYPYLLLRFDVKKISLLLAVLPVVVYTAIAGAKVTVIRASLMIILFVLAAFLGRIRDLYNVLFLAALLILLVAPHSLFEPSFQLSFTAVFSIVFLTPRITRLLPFPSESDEFSVVVRKMVQGVRTFLSVIIAATLGTLPLVLYHFQRFSLVSVSANLLIVPVLGFVSVPICLFVLLAYPFSTSVSTFLLECTEWFIDRALVLVEFFSTLPSASRFIPQPGICDVVLLYTVIFGFAKTLEFHTRGGDAKKEFRFVLFATVFFFLMFVVHYSYPLLKKKDTGLLRITVLDVGQGTSILINTPEGKSILLDGGGYRQGHFDAGKSIVIPYLLHKGITCLNVVALSHPHPDHYGGLIYTVENFPVKEFWYNGDDDVEEEMYHLLRDTVTKKKIPVRILKKQGEPFEFGGVNIWVLNPPADFEGETINDRSLVLHLTFRNTSVFLPADISQEVEKRLVAEHPDMRASVLVVSHHGSHHATSDELLKTLRPELAVISAGRDNTFGFPHEETIKRLVGRGIKVLRTDLHGAVTITLDGSGVKVETYRK